MEMLSCTSSSPAILEDALGARGGKDGWEGDKDREEYVNWRRAPATCLYMGWSTSPHRG